MNLGALRRATADLPDDTDVLGHMGDGEFWEMDVQQTLPPALEHPHAVTLLLGQPVTLQLDMDARIDAQLSGQSLCGDKHYRKGDNQPISCNRIVNPQSDGRPHRGVHSYKDDTFGWTWSNPAPEASA